MTLCIAWIRKTFDGEELIFATDSCLSGGERWKSGVKLFDLPRQDCLICFSGYTFRTYPLVLNLINSLKYDKHTSNQKQDVTQLAAYITELFTELIQNMSLTGGKTYEEILQDDPPFDFLFGGWSWKESKLKVWRIYYDFGLHCFVPDVNNENLVVSMIGDNLEEARNKLTTEIINTGGVLRGALNMEPLKVLVEIIRDDDFTEISGAVQLGKIYPPGATEFFGVYYPSKEGWKTFLGRNISKINNPGVRFIDPDTGAITDLDIPNSIQGFDLTKLGNDADIIGDCYHPEGNVKENLPEKERELAMKIFTDYSFNEFKSQIKKDQEAAQNQENE